MKVEKREDNKEDQDKVKLLPMLSNDESVN